MINKYIVAEIIYTEYCRSVGGVSYNGDPLPNWEEFSNDPEKTKQANAWLDAAQKAIDSFIDIPF